MPQLSSTFIAGMFRPSWAGPSHSDDGVDTASSSFAVASSSSPPSQHLPTHSAVSSSCRRSPCVSQLGPQRLVEANVAATMPLGGHSQAVPSMAILLQGELLSIPTDRQTVDVTCSGDSALHVVCVALHHHSAMMSAAPLRCRIVVRSQTSYSPRATLTLGVGDVAVVELSRASGEAAAKGQAGTERFEIDIELCGVDENGGIFFARNKSEQTFVSAAVATLLSAADGAPSLDAFLDSTERARWLPPHAATLLANDPQINTFVEARGGESSATAAGRCCCVARKKAKPKYHRRCPFVAQRLEIRDALRRAALGEPAWKQCGATFSTMMRHFQKAPDTFEWRTDDEKRTVIKHRKSPRTGGPWG